MCIRDRVWDEEPATLTVTPRRRGYKPKTRPQAVISCKEEKEAALAAYLKVDVYKRQIISIAEDCQTSLTATAIKITRICPDRVGIAYSEDGVIKWTAKTKSFPYELRKGLVNERSSINEFIITGCLSGDLRQIHPSAWVDSPYQGSHDWPCELSSCLLYTSRCV